MCHPNLEWIPWIFMLCNEIYVHSPQLPQIGVEWASYNIGIFLCTRCASVHRSIGAHISKVKHLKMDRWEDSEIERMKEIGNYKARQKYEQRVPACYRRPTEHDPQ